MLPNYCPLFERAEFLILTEFTCRILKNQGLTCRVLVDRWISEGQELNTTLLETNLGPAPTSILILSRVEQTLLKTQSAYDRQGNRIDKRKKKRSERKYTVTSHTQFGPLAIACQAVPTTVGFCVAFVVKVSAPQESYGDI